MLRQEMNIGYFHYIHRPGEKLGVLDNASDFEGCRERTHCNATHTHLGPQVVWDENQGKFILDDAGLQEKLEQFHSTFAGRRHSLLGGAEHNNVYFPGFYHYRKNIPQALMQDIDGNYLELKDPDIMDGKPIPMPAIDDPALLHIYAQQLKKQAESMAGCHYVAGYVMGAEMLYPEYFGLGNGDYRPGSWLHFTDWCGCKGVATPEKAETLVFGSQARNLWLRYREHAMADRAAFYFQAILSLDDTHLCFYPTHGSFMHGDSREKLGQHPSTLLGACDGIEMGHIMIDHDTERRNVILTSHNTSFGSPVIVPRLGNKTPDLGMAGGGRSFTPRTLRRFIYECVGLGISVIYPIHWRAHLHDGEWRIKDTPAEEECKKVFDELTLSAPYLTGMGRLQPQVGLLACDETWLLGWRPQWTGILQDAYANHDVITVISDDLVDEMLPCMMPVLVSVDNANVSNNTLIKLKGYLDAGGRLLVRGEFALESESDLRLAVLNHQFCFASKAPDKPHQSVLRENFLAGYKSGVTGLRYRYSGVDYTKFRDEIQTASPDAIIQPFHLDGDTSQVNVYALTDRSSMIAVLINNGSQAASFSIRADRRLLLGDFCIHDAVTGEQQDKALTLSAYETRMLCFSPHCKDDDQLEERICSAEDAFLAWTESNMDIGPLRHYYSGMRSGDHLERRFAMASVLLSSLVIKPQAEISEEGDLLVTAEVLDAEQKNPLHAKLWMRLVPGQFRRFKFVRLDEQFICRIPLKELSCVYQPETYKYVPIHGPVRIIIQAEDEGRQGGCIYNYTIGLKGGQDDEN